MYQKVLNYLGQDIRLRLDELEPRVFQQILDAVKGTDVEQVAQS